jgi:DNA-binding MarR family transcriptional regulator
MKRLDASATTDDVERLLTEIIKSYFARDVHVPGLMELPVAQLRVLTVLDRSRDARNPTMGELAERMSVALSTATQLVERIEKRGLVRREHSDPEDRRVVRLGLTSEGLNLMDERRRLRRERLAAALDHLTVSQREQVVEILTPLAAASRQVEQESSLDDAALPGLMRAAG